jgi:tellurium resistance protein TerD
MGVNLSKGAKVDLTKTNPGIKLYRVGLGWNANASVGNTFDLDVSAFLLDEHGKCTSEENFVFYNNLKSPNDFVVHTGDNRTGAGSGDDEKLIVDFNKVLPNVKKVLFVVTIDGAAAKQQNFGQVSGAYIRIMDETKAKAADALTDEAAQEAAYKAAEILKYDLNEDYSIETAVLFGSIYEKDGEWKFSADGVGRKEGLDAYVHEFGLQTA